MQLVILKNISDPDIPPSQCLLSTSSYPIEVPSNMPLFSYMENQQVIHYYLYCITFI